MRWETWGPGMAYHLTNSQIVLEEETDSMQGATPRTESLVGRLPQDLGKA